MCYESDRVRALATVPGLGLVVQGVGGCLQVLATPKIMRLWNMSAIRVTWMSTVARGIMYCRETRRDHLCRW
jgi:hypothetical protein